MIISPKTNLHDKWEESYRRKENFVFYPHEEIIRFVSKYIRKRVGLDEWKDVSEIQWGGAGEF